MIHLRILLAAVAVTFASALALASSVQAHDCGARIQSIQDVGSADNIQDCLRTGQTYGVTIGAVVAGVGVVIAIVGLPGRRPAPPPRPASPPPPVQRREPEPPHHADPCFDQQVRHTTARAGARTTFNALQTLRTQRGYLESLWESTRETGYLSAVVDVGMMAGSLWTKPLAAGLGMTLAKQALAQKAAESVLKALGKELAKDLIKHLEDQHIDWIDVLGKAGESRTKSLATEMIKEQLTKIEFDRMAAELAGTGKVPDLAAIEKDFSGPIGDAAGQMVDIVKLGSSTMKVSEKLEAIRKAISTVDDHVFTAEERWESAVNEMDLAHDSLNRCRDLHGAAGGQA